MKTYDVAVIGSGPAGLLAAGRCSKAGLRVLLIEKNARLGLKLLASGSGQCNITNTDALEKMIQHFGDKERFVRKALQTFTSDNLLEYFQDRGVAFVKMENGKVFPKSRKAEEILKALEMELQSNGVNVQTNQNVEQILKQTDHYRIETSDQNYQSRCVLIATGGKSYPNLGTTGDGYKWAQQLGHTIVRPKPALAPVYNASFELLDLAGMTFRNVDISLWRNQKKLLEVTGDLLITHKGLSGPVILDNSRFFEKGDQIQINFARFRNESDFRHGFMMNLESLRRASIKRMLDSYDIPKRLIDKLLEITATRPDTKCAELPKNNRNALIKALTGFPFVIENVGDYQVAMATAGGVSTKEINSKTYESRIIDDLYFAGEVLDVDGNTGGYNIQFAFSSAYMASETIIDKLR